MPKNLAQPFTPPAHDDFDMGLVTKGDIAGLCRVSPRTVEAWVKEKRIPFIRLGHRSLRFDPHAVMAAVRRWSVREIC
jgi:excisionase family DNA binding protein